MFISCVFRNGKRDDKGDNPPLSGKASGTKAVAGRDGRKERLMYKQARPHQKRRKRSGDEVREEGLAAARALLLDRGPAAVTLANIGQAIVRRARSSAAAMSKPASSAWRLNTTCSRLCIDSW